MIDEIKRLQVKSRDEKCVLFPNLLREIENGYITDAGMDALASPLSEAKKSDVSSSNKKAINDPLTYAALDPKRKRKSEKEDRKEKKPKRFKFPENVIYNLKIGDSKKDDLFFSLFSKKNLRELLFGGNEKFVYLPIFPSDLTVEECLNDPKLTTQAANYLIRINKIPLNKEFFNKCIWITKHEHIIPIIEDVNSIVHSLGLSYLCNSKDSKDFMGLIFQVNGEKFKPNIFNNPLGDAYCCLPKVNNGWGNTFHLSQLESSLDEAVFPKSYWKHRGKIHVTDIKIYNDLDADPIDVESIIQSIHKVLSYNTSDEYLISVENSVLSINKQ